MHPRVRVTFQRIPQRGAVRRLPRTFRRTRLRRIRRLFGERIYEKAPRSVVARGRHRSFKLDAAVAGHRQYEEMIDAHRNHLVPQIVVEEITADHHRNAARSAIQDMYGTLRSFYILEIRHFPVGYLYGSSFYG